MPKLLFASQVFNSAQGTVNTIANINPADIKNNGSNETVSDGDFVFCLNTHNNTMVQGYKFVSSGYTTDNIPTRVATATPDTGAWLSALVTKAFFGHHYANTAYGSSVTR